MIRKNDEFTLEITDLGTNGEGIGRLNQGDENDGYTVFVKDALIGDKIRTKIIKPKKKLRLRPAYGDHYPVALQSRAAMSCSPGLRRMPDHAPGLQGTAAF